MSGPASSRALILDVDGVVSPVHGHTAWGDDVVAGHVFGPVVVSPAMCHRLDQLAQLPGVRAVWLTSWSRRLRHRMNPFPGRAWPQIRGGPDDPAPGWWKWAALLRWLDHSRGIAKLAWCDDHLADGHLIGLQATGSRELSMGDEHHGFPVMSIAAIHAELSRRGVDHLTVAPATSTGITRQQLTLLESFLSAP